MAQDKKKGTTSVRGDDLAVAIVGAGLSGLIAGRTLDDHGLTVRLFDKARGPGGRMATRRREAYAFDHGAQYFTARDERFRRYVDSWIDDGLVQAWTGRMGVAEAGMLTPKDSETTRYVGTPRMSALTRYLSTSLDIAFQTRVAQVERDAFQWRLFSDEGADLGAYDVVLVTTPPAQAAPLLTGSPELFRRVEEVEMLPCWAVMAVFAEPLDLPYDGLFVHDAPLSWVARNSSKPGRPPQESWVLHGAPGWSQAHLEEDGEEVASQLLHSFFNATGLEPVDASFVQAHRWRYAMADEPLDVGCLWDAEQRLGVCGDWCNNSRVEGAFLSGMALAGRVLGLPDQTVSQQADVETTP